MKMHVIASGSKGNASIIYNDDTVILVDMGTTKTRLVQGLKEVNKKIKDINYVFFTHEHCDHINGISFLNSDLFYCRAGTLKVPKNHELEIFKEYNFGSFKVTPLLTSHDATSPCGYLFSDKKDSLIYLTDSGYIPESTLPYLQNKNYYFFESNHDVEMLLNSSRPEILKKRILSDFGHLSNEQSAKYLVYAVGEQTKGIMLAHLSEECNTPEKALETYKEIFNSEGVSLMKINLTCAKQYESEDFIK